MKNNIIIGTFSYPKIIFPEELEKIYKWDISMPLPKVPIRPILASHESVFLAALICFISVIGALFCLAFWFEGNVGVGIVGTWFCVSIVYASYSSVKEGNLKNESRNKEYAYAVKYYADYVYPLFVKEKEEYDHFMKNINNEVFMKEISHRKSLHFLSSSTPPSPLTEYNVRQGASEKYFVKYLKWYFNEHVTVLTNHTILHETCIHQRPYMPDVVLYIKNINLSIDIEIDEPYSAENKEPIHYIGSKDDERNDFFTSFGWIVIRFTEEQIIRNSSQCCHMITEIINLYRPIYNLSNIEDKIEYIPAWTEDEALQMANNNYRSTYLVK